MTLTPRCSVPPANSEIAFASLGDITRAGNSFSAPDHDVDAVRVVQRYRMFRMHCLTTTLNIVDVAQANMLPRCLVSVRLKRLDSIRRKIGRGEKQFALGQMDDVIGVRVVCPNFQSIFDLSKRIQSLSEFHRLKDYISNSHPAETGYRAIHHIIRFRQPLTEAIDIPVRFEIQVRSFYQHQWAVWSESFGERIKAGLGSKSTKLELKTLSNLIEKWEENHPEKIQYQLPEYSSGSDIIVAWRQAQGESTTSYYPFRNDVLRAAEWLNYLERKYPAERGNALLLVGVTTRRDAHRILSITHPSYISRVISPEYWMPK